MEFDKRVITSSIVGLALGVASTCMIMLATNDGREVVAKIDNTPIRQSELSDRLITTQGSLALDSLISSKIVDMESEKNKITLTDDEVKEELNLLITQYGTEEALVNSLKSQGTNLDEVKEDIKTYLKSIKLLGRDLNIADEEIEEFFNQNKSSLDTPATVSLSHILVNDEATANEIIKKLENGEAFEDLVKQYSLDESTKEQAGNIGVVSQGYLNPELIEVEKKAFESNKGLIKTAIKSSYGYHIVNVLDKTEAKEATLEASKSYIMNVLVKNKYQTVFPTWLEDKKEEYKVEEYLTKS